MVLLLLLYLLLLLPVFSFSANHHHLRKEASLPAPSAFVWSASDNYIRYNNTPFLIKGVNLHGIETTCKIVDGMWQQPLDFFLDRITKWGVNWIRIPISFEVMHDLDNMFVKDGCAAADPKYKNYSVGQFLEVLFTKLDERNIFALVDKHNIGGAITPYPYTDVATEPEVIKAWTKFVSRYSPHKSLVAIQIQNEPHGECDLPCAFGHAKRVIDAVDQGTGFKGLYVLSGVQYAPTHNDSGAWGGILNSLLDPDIPSFEEYKNRIVLSVHVYGFDVRGPVALEENEDTFERHFGFVSSLNGTAWDRVPVLITEYGGYMEPGSKDMIVYDRLEKYISKRPRTGTFMWTTGQSSMDTHGIVTGNDWRGEDTNKLSYMELLQPHPTGTISHTSTLI